MAPSVIQANAPLSRPIATEEAMAASQKLQRPPKPIKSFKEYNYFVIYELYKYIKTTHILLVQWDGFVINHKKWLNSFLDNDYIGAPFITRSKDFNYCRNSNGGFYSVGNGGFSIRSLKLLEAAKKYNLKDNYTCTKNHEDGFFSVRRL